jgi:hypothetical protein
MSKTYIASEINLSNIGKKVVKSKSVKWEVVSLGPSVEVASTEPSAEVVSDAPSVEVVSIKPSVDSIKPIAEVVSDAPSVEVASTEPNAEVVSDAPSVEVVSDLNSIKPKKKMSDSQYQKKLEKKAEKARLEKERTEAELKEQTDIIEKEHAYAHELAQKAYDEEYPIAFIEEPTKEAAIKKAQSIYDQVYKTAIDKLKSVKETKKLIKDESIKDEPIKEASIKDEPIPSEDLSDLSDSSRGSVKKIKPSKHIPITIDLLNQNTITEEESKTFKVIQKKKTSKQNFINALESSKKILRDIILNTKTLAEISKINIDSNYVITTTINIDEDIIQSTPNSGVNITKSGFLKNTNFMFSKYLSSEIKTIYKSLNLFIKINKINENTYELKFMQKKILTLPEEMHHNNEKPTEKLVVKINKKIIKKANTSNVI